MSWTCACWVLEIKQGYAKKKEVFVRIILTFYGTAYRTAFQVLWTGHHSGHTNPGDSTQGGEVRGAGCGWNWLGHVQSGPLPKPDQHPQQGAWAAGVPLGAPWHRKDCGPSAEGHAVAKPEQGRAGCQHRAWGARCVHAGKAAAAWDTGGSTTRRHSPAASLRLSAEPWKCGSCHQQVDVPVTWWVPERYCGWSGAVCLVSWFLKLF